MPSQGPAIAGLQNLELIAPIATHRFIARDTLREEQALDPIDVAGSLLDQDFAFPANAASILLVDARRPDHCAHSRFAALVR